MTRREDELDDLRETWRALESEDESSDPRTLAVVATLRETWRTMPIPSTPPIARPAPHARWRRLLPLAAALVLATVFLARSRRVEPVAPPSVAPNSEWRLVADLTIATLGGAPRTALLPAFCLCCEALLIADSSRLWPIAPGGEPDHAIAAAIAADCRGDWSEAVAILEPTLAGEFLTDEQRIRASAALSHAYRQLGRTDEATRAERALVSLR